MASLAGQTSGALMPVCYNKPHRNQTQRAGARHWSLQGTLSEVRFTYSNLGIPELDVVLAVKVVLLEMSTEVSQGVRNGSLTLNHPILFFKASCMPQICSFPNYNPHISLQPF